MQLNINNFVGSRYLINIRDASLIKERIKISLDAKEKIKLDFSGVILFGSEFMEEMFQDIFFNFTREYIEKHIMISGIKKFGDRFNLMFDNYERFAKDPVHRGLLIAAYEAQDEKNEKEEWGENCFTIHDIDKLVSV